MTRTRITYANVTATLALALVVGGGTAYAAGLAPGSVGTPQLKKGAVTTPKLAKDAVVSAKVKNGSLKIADFAPAQVPLTGTVVRATTFTFPVSPGSTGQLLDETAECAPGETVVSGGYGLNNNVSVNGAPNVIVSESRPAANADGDAPAAGSAPQGWYVEAERNSGAVSTTVTVWVLCAS